MALANFFDKISLSAAQRLKDYDRSGFEKKLQAHRIGIVYGKNAIHTSEGKVGLDLIVRLLSRLYPAIVFIDCAIDEKSKSYTEELKSIAQKINPIIDCSDGLPATANILIGKIEDYSLTEPTFFIGSENWNASFSRTKPQPCHNFSNPFGVGAAVCFAAANLFRFIFNDELGNPSSDNDFIFSTLTQEINESAFNPSLPVVIPVSFTLIGTGAIGNATLWSILQLSGLSGKVNLIDDQDVALSNLQRYVLMDQDDILKKKVEILKAKFRTFPDLIINSYSEKWQLIAGNLSLEQKTLIATALDTPEERIKIQGILPRKIINAWTGPDSLGVSRHLDFEKELCLSCLYIPSGKQKDYSEKVAESLGMGQQEIFIRQYLADHLPIDDTFISVVSQDMNRSPEDLMPYKGQQVALFYSEAICGGKVIPINNQHIEVPLAHESVLAGILLAAEIVIENLFLRKQPIDPLTKINLLKPLHPYLSEKETKHYSGNCICQDELFINRFREKWL